MAGVHAGVLQLAADDCGGFFVGRRRQPYRFVRVGRIRFHRIGHVAEDRVDASRRLLHFAGRVERLLAQQTDAA
jgi:hypothetical protein